MAVSRCSFRRATLEIAVTQHAGSCRISEDGPAVSRVEPVLAPGPLGAFDDSGAMGSCLVCHDDRELLYFIGWNLGVSVPF